MDIADEIEKRGSTVVKSTISKALKRLESDLMIERSKDAVTLLQPEKLLQRVEERRDKADRKQLAAARRRILASKKN